MSQKALALRYGTTEASMSRWLSGLAAPDPVVAAELAALAGVDLLPPDAVRPSPAYASTAGADTVTSVPLAAAGVGAGAGQLEEREIPRWESEENAARSRRARLRIVTTPPSTSPPDS